MKSTPNIHQAPPHSVEAEQGAISSMLLNPKEVIGECIAQITPDYFYVPTHQTIYTILVELWTEGTAIDLVTFTQVLRDRSLLETVGGPSYVTHLYTFVPSAANIDYYLDILESKYILRQIIAFATEGARRAFEDQTDAWSLLGEMQEKLASIANSQHDQHKSIEQLVDEKMERMEKGLPDEDIIKTGILKIDALSPVREGDMPVLSGETKAGKSILSLTIAKNIAMQGEGVAIFGLESSVHEGVDRLFSSVSHIPQRKLDHVKNLDSTEVNKVMEAAGVIKRLPLYLYDNIFDLHHIIAEARRLKAQRKIRLIVIDYAQLVRTRIGKDRSREQEVAHISRSFRLLGLELKVPVILLSQLNEAGRSRESRAIEQDCTALWKIRAPSEDEEENPKWTCVKFIEIPIQRNGESGIRFPVTFLGHEARVENFTADDIRI